MAEKRVVAKSANGRQLVVRIRELRGDRTLSDVAAQVGIRQDDLSRIERGETSSIRYETILKLCTEFHVGPEALFRIEEENLETSSPLEKVLAAVARGDIELHQVPKNRRRQSIGNDEEVDPKDIAILAQLQKRNSQRHRTQSLNDRLSKG